MSAEGAKIEINFWHLNAAHRNLANPKSVNQSINKYSTGKEERAKLSLHCPKFNWTWLNFFFMEKLTHDEETFHSQVKFCYFFQLCAVQQNVYNNKIEWLHDGYLKSLPFLMPSVDCIFIRFQDTQAFCRYGRHVVSTSLRSLQSAYSISIQT